VEDFVKMTKGINNGGDLPYDFLKGIYDHIEKEPFSLVEDDDARIKLEAQAAKSAKSKHEIFLKECQGYIKRGAAIIKENKSQNTQFLLVNDTEPIRPMFENTWSANLAVFSVLLEESDDPKITELCIEGFMNSIKVTGFYQMHVERDAFVSSLSKFT